MATIGGTTFLWNFVAFGQVTLHLNFGRTGAVARTTLSGVSAGALAGISQFRTRAAPDGPDQETSFPFDFRFGFPPIVAADNMTSVTAELVSQGFQPPFGGPAQGSLVTLTVDFWG